MKRLAAWSTAFTCVAIAAATIVHADVKTVQKTQFKLAGLLGGLMNRFGGQAAKDGVTSTVAVKGARKSSVNDLTGQIVDLTEQKVYALDVKKKEYTVKTFAQIRADYEKARADAQKQMDSMKTEDKAQAQEAGKQMDFELKVDDTGQHRSIAGYDAREVIMTLTTHEKGKTIDDSGGFIMTSDMWIGPKIAALDEVRQFEMKYYKAIYGESLEMDMQQMAQMAGMYPGFQSMMGRMQTEGSKMTGTPLETNTTFDGVKSAEQMKQVQQQPAQPSGGGGLGGMLGRRLAGNRGAQAQEARANVMTTTMAVQSIQTSVADADVQIPAGYKEKK